MGDNNPNSSIVPSSTLTASSTVTAKNFTFNPNAEKNGGTIMGPFVNKGDQEVNKYAVIIEGNIIKNSVDGNITFESIQNSIFLFKDNDPYASIYTNETWVPKQPEFIPGVKLKDSTIDIINKINAVAVSGMLGGRVRTPRRKYKASRRMYHKK